MNLFVITHKTAAYLWYKRAKSAFFFSSAVVFVCIINKFRHGNHSVYGYILHDFRNFVKVFFCNTRHIIFGIL